MKSYLRFFFRVSDSSLWRSYEGFGRRWGRCLGESSKKSFSPTPRLVKWTDQPQPSSASSGLSNQIPRLQTSEMYTFSAKSSYLYYLMRTFLQRTSSNHISIQKWNDWNLLREARITAGLFNMFPFTILIVLWTSENMTSLSFFLYNNVR